MLRYVRFSASNISRTFMNVEKESARRNARTPLIAALFNKNKQNFCFFPLLCEFFGILETDFQKMRLMQCALKRTARTVNRFCEQQMPM